MFSERIMQGELKKIQIAIYNNYYFMSILWVTHYFTLNFIKRIYYLSLNLFLNKNLKTGILNRLNKYPVITFA